jgi:gamma-glutamylaminecyclotransferase
VGKFVFVYGTLKRGERNHHRMAGARFVGPAVTRDAAFTLIEQASVSTPGRTTPSVSPDGAHRIAGEIYEVDDTLLAALDDFERVGLDYERRTVALADGHSASIYLRLASRPDRRPITGFVHLDGDVAGWSGQARP